MVISKWLFANLYNFLDSVVDPKVRPFRILTAGKCHGKVLEIGAGTGANLPFLPDAVEVVVIEPDKFMRSKLIAQSKRLGIDVQVLPSKGENLAFPDDSFDCVFTTLVLCMVDDVEKVLSEVYRVLKPGGQFYFYEHVISKTKLGIKIHYLCTWHNVLNEIKKGKILRNKDIENIEKFLFEPNNWKVNG